MQSYKQLSKSLKEYEKKEDDHDCYVKVSHTLLAHSDLTKELNIYMEEVNKLGIGAQGLGGLTTVMDVKINDYPTHAASLPVCMIPNCAATRHAHFVLDGSGPALQTPPNLDDWPEVTQEEGDNVRRVNLDTVTREEAAEWQPGDVLLLSGKMLTGRDAAHKKMKEFKIKMQIS